MERTLLLSLIGFVAIIVILLLVIRSTAPKSVVVTSAVTPSPIAYASPAPTQTPVPTGTRAPVPTVTAKPTPQYYLAATPRPSATPTPVPIATLNPVIYPSGNQPGRLVGTITNKAPFDKGIYIVTVETPNYQSFDLFTPPNVPIYDQNGQRVGLAYLAVGQIVQATTLPATTDFTTQSIRVIG